MNITDRITRSPTVPAIDGTELDWLIEQYLNDRRTKVDAKTMSTYSCRLRLVIEITEERPAAHPHKRARAVHAHALHRRKVDDESAIANGIAGHVMPAAPHRDRQLLLPGKAHCSRDVGRTGAARNRARSPVDHAVPDSARSFVALIPALENRTAMPLPEFLDLLGIQRTSRHGVFPF